MEAAKSRHGPCQSVNRILQIVFSDAALRVHGTLTQGIDAATNLCEPDECDHVGTIHAAMLCTRNGDSFAFGRQAGRPPT